MVICVLGQIIGVSQLELRVRNLWRSMTTSDAVPSQLAARKQILHVAQGHPI